MMTVSPSDLSALRAVLLNTSGTIPLHNRFRALFTLKSLKNDEAVKVISEGGSVFHSYFYGSYGIPPYPPYYFIPVIFLVLCTIKMSVVLTDAFARLLRPLSSA